MPTRVCQIAKPRGRRASWLAGALAALVLIVSPARADEPPRPEVPQPEVAPIPLLDTPVGDLAYHPGRGFRLGDTGLTLGGFATLGADRREGNRGRVRLDAFDLFLFLDPTPYLHLFSDLSFDHVLELDDKGNSGALQTETTVQRLYGDYNWNDQLNVRIGKFLTPVGRWNQVPAEPLVWTASRPVVTDRPFATHTAGGALYGSVFPGGGSLSYTVYGQFFESFADRTQAHPADESGGVRFDYSSLAGWSVGASYIAFDRKEHWNHLGGVDGLWQRGRFELSGEFLAGQGDPDAKRVVGLYLQGVAELVARIYAVGRYEYYDPSPADPALNMFDFGLAWRPVSFLIFKADYRVQDRTSSLVPAGFQASASILF